MLKPAKLLNDHLYGLCVIDKPDLTSLHRLDDNRKQKYLISNKDNLFSSNIDDLIFNVSAEDAFKNLAQTVIIHHHFIKFNLMVVPIKAVEYTRLDFFNNVIVRVIEYYEIRIDEMLTRYDILIEKADTNAN